MEKSIRIKWSLSVEGFIIIALQTRVKRYLIQLRCQKLPYQVLRVFSQHTNKKSQKASPNAMRWESLRFIVITIRQTYRRPDIFVFVECIWTCAWHHTYIRQFPMITRRRRRTTSSLKASVAQLFCFWIQWRWGWKLRLGCGWRWMRWQVNRWRGSYSSTSYTFSHLLRYAVGDAMRVWLSMKPVVW